MIILENALVLRHDATGGDYRMLDMRAPRLAPAIRPGQFVHLRVPRLADAALRRPFSVFQAEDDRLAILYRVVGRGTAALGRIAPGETVDLLGPLGNGFPLDIGARLPVLVAGGYGVAPLYLLARALPRRGLVFIGGARAADILCRDEFASLGWTVHMTTEDGSLGERGLVTRAVDAWLDARPPDSAPVFFACGPNGLLKAVGDRALAGGWPAWLSLDRHMGCGMGACLACVQRLKRGGATVWARVCKDGPVFEAREVIWDENA